jgi:LacI family transcriptional regulator
MGHNDYVAERAMQRLIEAGFQIPLDAAVIGADDDPLFHGVAPIPLSSVSDNGEYVGYRAAEILDAMMHGEAAPREPVPIQPARVVERESTNILAISHAPTAKALQLLKQHYAESVNLDEVAMQAGMCRRRLEDYFLKLVGHSMAGELRRLRIEEARHLLTASGCKISEVAQKVGFANVAHFASRFRKTVGARPSACRTAGLPKARRPAASESHLSSALANGSSE